jgi:hypothetical protein
VDPRRGTDVRAIVRLLGPVGRLRTIEAQPMADGSWSFDQDAYALFYLYDRIALFPAAAGPLEEPPTKKMAETHGTDYDYDHDGLPERRLEITRDEHGNMIELVIYYDDDRDGKWERKEICSYRVDRQGITREHCKSFSYRYYSNRSYVEIEVDDDNDGKPERRVTFTRIVEEAGEHVATRVKYDDDADGRVDRIKLIHYDRLGRVRRIEYDDNADGIIDRVYPATEPL